MYLLFYFHIKTGHGFNNFALLKSLVVKPLKKFTKLLGNYGYFEIIIKMCTKKDTVLNGKDLFNFYNNLELEIVNQIGSERLKQVKENYFFYWLIEQMKKNLKTFLEAFEEMNSKLSQ